MAITHLNTNNFESVTGQGLVLLDFWASWCGPCRMQAPVLEALDAEMGDRVKVCKIDVDEEPQLARRFRVLSIPTLVAMQDGAVKASHVGYTDLDGLKAMLA